MKVIAVSLSKGGVGKTTISVNLAAALGLEGLRVLVVDLDSVGYATTWLGITMSEIESNASAYGVITRKAQLSQAVYETEEQSLFICPAHSSLINAAGELGARLDGLFVLKDTFAAAARDELPFDVAILDCPGEQNTVVFNAIIAADLVIAPVLSHNMSLDGLADVNQMMDTIRSRFRPELRHPYILLNDYVGQAASDRQIKDYLVETFGREMFQTIIGRDAPLRECYNQAQSIFRYRRSARSAGHFRALAQEVREVLA
jgi:chromosome partitioning protein